MPMKYLIILLIFHISFGIGQTIQLNEIVSSNGDNLYDEDGDTYWNEGETVTIREGKGVCGGPESDIGGCKMTFQIKTVNSEGEESLLQELKVTVE